MLNNRGWGLNEMLILCVIIILAGFVSYSIYKKTFGDKDIMHYWENNAYNGEVSNISYSKLENQMVEAASNYVNKKNIDLNDMSAFYVKLSILVKDNYIDTISDGNSKCSGYVKMTEKYKKAYLKCPNYQTSGYESEYD